MNKEDAFFELVSKAAHEKKSEFFLISGEGREIETSEIEGEDLFGWLIPEKNVEEFQKEYADDNISSKWDEFYRFAIWSKNGDDIKIEFKRMTAC